MHTFKLTLALLVPALALPFALFAAPILGPQVNVNAPTGYSPYDAYGSQRISECPSGSVFTGLETTQFSANGDTVNEWTPFNIDKIHCRSTTASLGPVVSIPAPTGQPTYWGYGKSVADCPSGSVFTGLEATQFSANGDTVNEWTPFNIDRIHCRSMSTAPVEPPPSSCNVVQSYTSPG